MATIIWLPPVSESPGLSQCLQREEGRGQKRFAYDGLGRRITQRSINEERHFYYDQAGRVVSEMVQSGAQRFLEREFIWDANEPLRLVCRLRYGPAFPSGPERLYPLQDILGHVTALIDETGQVKERFVYDTQGHVTYLDAAFNTKPVQQSGYDWEQFIAGMRFDRRSGFHFVGSTYYHADLGRVLPLGSVSVLPESVLNSYVEDLPFGDYRPPPAHPLTTMLDSAFKWLGEQPQWVKCTLGVVFFVAAVTACFVLPGPGWLLALGLVAGAVAGGVGTAFFSEGKAGYGDITLSAGIGALFGALCPAGALGSLYGSMVGLEVAAIGRLLGCDWMTYSAGWHWGGLVGGLAGGIHQEAVWAARAGQSRSLVSLALWGAGPEFLGGGAGVAYGYLKDGTSASALHYANMGVMIGGIAGGARGLWSVRRAEPIVLSPAAAAHPGRVAAESALANEHSVLRALRAANTPESHAVAKLIKRRSVKLKLLETDPSGEGAAGRKPWGSNVIEVYRDKASTPFTAAGIAAHETEHWLQQITPATYRRIHEFEAYQFQRRAGFLALTDDEIWQLINTSPLYKNVPH